MTQEMKQYAYTGNKTVKAMFMTMGEAYERKLLEEGVKPSEDETYKAGYLVEYKDGYQLWSPAETFEQAYKPSDTALDRLRIEYSELRERFRKLDKYTNISFRKLAEKVGVHQASLLGVQCKFMNDYLEVLEARIADMEKDGDEQ